MKKIIALSLSILFVNNLLAQVPKTLIGQTFYNVNQWNLNPRFGGIPSIKFTSANQANIKKGDVMENAVVKKYKNGFILTTNYTKKSDTFQFQEPINRAFTNGAEMKDTKGQVWSTRFSTNAEEKAVANYPAAKAGFKMNTIVLPPLKNEANVKVEIYAGVLEEVDCNSYSMLGVIEEKNLDGFGYTYYNVKTEEKLMGTMMGCPGNTKTLKFISVQPILARYNSKTPMVIYAPENVQIRYKIYTSDDDWYFAKPK